MFKFDKFTRPYYISNFIFYLFTLVVLALIYYYVFWPPISEVTTEDFFANYGLREFGGTLFFLVLIIVPLLVIAGMIYHLIKSFTANGQKQVEE